MNGTPNDFPSLKPGGHVCLPYLHEEEKHAAIAGYIHDGILRGERCIYWGHAAAFAALLPNLESVGLPVSSMRERGRLVFADATQNASTWFDENVQAAAMRSAVAAARSEGYAGLRVTSDPDPMTRSSVGREQLTTLEHSLSRLCEELHATGLCTYDQSAGDPWTLEVGLATHELAFIAGRLCPNPYFRSRDDAQDSPSGQECVDWMATNILEAAKARELLEAESAALIVESSRSDRREAEHRRQIAALVRAVEARDRLLITTARWLSRPLSAMCTHLDDLAKDDHFHQYHSALGTWDEHLAAVTRLSNGLDEIASFLQLQVVLRPENLDIVEVARATIVEIEKDKAIDEVEIALEGSARIAGTWDRLRLSRLFHSLIRTAREQGYDARVRLRLDDLLQFVRVRLEFMLPHAPALSDSGERVRALAYGSSGESDYERLAVRLWPAREIVRMMGGTLGISTWADARVIFTLDLPKSSQPLSSEERQGPFSAPEDRPPGHS